MDEEFVSAVVAAPTIAIAAFAIWVAVLIVNRWKKIGVTFWGVLSVVLALYPLSFGPACWISSHSRRGASVVSIVYQPLFNIWWSGAPGIQDVVEWYGSACANDGWDVGLPEFDGNGLRWDDYSGSTHVSLAAAFYYANAIADANEREPDTFLPVNGDDLLTANPDVTPRSR
jgi:hypothetical protein